MLKTYQVLPVFECCRYNPLPFSVYLLLSSWIEYAGCQNNTFVRFNFKDEFGEFIPMDDDDEDIWAAFNTFFLDFFASRLKYRQDIVLGKFKDSGWKSYPLDCDLEKLTLEESIRNTKNYLERIGVSSWETILLEVSW